MTDKKAKFAEMNLTEEDLVNKMKMLTSLKISEEMIALQLETDKKMLTTDLPMRRLKSQIEQGEQELERTRKNIKVIEKQIKSGKEKHFK